MEIDNKVYIDKFDYYQFEYKVSSKNIRGVVATIAPYTEHFGFFYFGFNSVQKIDNLLRRIEFDPFIDGKKIWCGVEDAVIIIDEKEKNIADFQVRLPGFGSVLVHLNIL